MSQKPDQDLLLPEGSHLLHIGPQKTGTTTLQVALHRSRDGLREHGVAFPVRGSRPRKAVWGLLGAPEWREQPGIEQWHRFVREVAEVPADLRVCISTEDWARTDHDGATKVVEGLGGKRPHIAVTARRLDRLFPSQWQQRVKMRRTTLTYDGWLEIVLGDDEDDPVWRNVWVPHDIESVVERWAKAAGGPENLTLIVADESDRNLLPRTFEQMLGLPDGLLQKAASDVRNESIGYGRVEAIRQLTQAFHEHGWSDDADLDTVHRRLTDALKGLAPWPDEQRVPALPGWAAKRVAELSSERAELVRSLPVRVVGDPDNLLMPESAPVATSEEGPVMVSAEMTARMLEQAVEILQEQRAALQDEHKQRMARMRRRQSGEQGPRVDEVAAKDLLKVVVRRGLRRFRP